MEWFVSFLLTCLVELPVFFSLLKNQGRRVVLVAGLTMNAVSHPLLWFVFPLIFPRAYFILIGEITVIFLEYFILTRFFRKERKDTLLFVSFLVNALSFLAGEMIYLIGF
jgi:hypothetical protein